MRIGIFGGTFNPIHKGHERIAHKAIETGELDRLIVMPANVPPHKTAASLATAADRLEMCRLAFDGDADRCLAVDENGEVIDGDRIIAICAKHMKQGGKLNKDTAVVTVMTNMGFYKFCDENGISYEMCLYKKKAD